MRNPEITIKGKTIGMIPATVELVEEDNVDILIKNCGVENFVRVLAKNEQMAITETHKDSGTIRYHCENHSLESVTQLAAIGAWKFSFRPHGKVTRNG